MTRGYKVAIVEWEDASHYRESESIDWLKQNASLTNVSTTGFVLKVGKKEVIITHEINEADKARDISVIARRDIKKIIYLKAI